VHLLDSLRERRRHTELTTNVPPPSTYTAKLNPTHWLDTTTHLINSARVAKPTTCRQHRFLRRRFIIASLTCLHTQIANLPFIRWKNILFTILPDYCDCDGENQANELITAAERIGSAKQNSKQSPSTHIGLLSGIIGRLNKRVSE